MKWLKISFWFSILLSIWTSSLGCMAGDYAIWCLWVALFAVPGIFIKARVYKLAAILIFCAYLVFAYQDREAGKRREAWMPQLKKIQEEKNVNP